MGHEVLRMFSCGTLYVLKVASIFASQVFFTKHDFDIVLFFYYLYYYNKTSINRSKLTHMYLQLNLMRNSDAYKLWLSIYIQPTSQTLSCQYDGFAYLWIIHDFCLQELCVTVTYQEIRMVLSTKN